MRILGMLASLILTLMLAACGDNATQTTDAGSGPDPKLPQAVPTVLIPTVDVAKAIGWPKGKTPTPAAGLSVSAFAEGLDHPRWLYTLPNGDVLVAETNAPSRPDNNTGVKGWVMGLIMSSVGAGVPCADRITLLHAAARR